MSVQIVKAAERELPMARCLPLMKCSRFPARRVRGVVRHLGTANKNITNSNSQRHTSTIVVKPCALRTFAPRRDTEHTRTCGGVLERVGQQRGGQGSGRGGDVRSVLKKSDCEMRELHMIAKSRCHVT